MPTSRPSLKETLAAFVLFAALSALHTWPLASAPHTISRHDNSDAMLNEWIVAWVAHALPRDPAGLFDAPIFHDEPNTLAFSEHLFAQSLMGAPLLWAGVPTLLVYNLLVLAGFTFSGLSMWFVTRRITGDWAAGLLGGMLLAFNSHSLSRIAHLQAMHVEFLPLALLALDMVLRAPRPIHAFALAGAFVLQSLTSNYLLVFTTFALMAAAAVRPGEWLGRGRRKVFLALCVAGLVSIVALAPFLIPYYKAQQQQGLTRELGEVTRFSGQWTDYLAAAGTFHFNLWSARFWRGDGVALFPGVVPLLLAAVAVASGAGWRDRNARMWLAVGIAGFLLSFGTSMPGYTVLYAVMPLLQGIRATVRFGFLFIAAIACLAAFGLAVIRSRWVSEGRTRTVITYGVLALATLETLRAPVGYERAHNTPAPFYERLNREPNAVLVELPLFRPHEFFRNAEYMLHQTVHWKPLLNGYSGFRPEQYDRHFEALRAFPDASAVDYLRSRGVTHIVVHENRFKTEHGAENFDRLKDAGGLAMVLAAPGLTMWRIVPLETQGREP